MAHSGDMLARFELPSWKSWLSWTGAVLTSALFLLAGLWKITDAPGFAVRLSQLKVPPELTLPASVLLGIVETFSAVLILVPRFRRWGAWIGTLTTFEPYRPLFIGLTLLFLGLAFRNLYLVPQACAPGTPCADPQTTKRQRLIFWSVAVLLLGLLAVPWFAPLFY